MTDLQVLDMRPFVPARDFEQSRRFYRELGFSENWANPEICELQLGGYRFLLQNYYVREWAENFMMSLMVEDADRWWELITASQLAERYGLEMVRPPAMQPWGLRVLYLADPSGVLWHITERPGSEDAG